MIKLNRKQKIVGILLVVVILLVLPAIVLAQDEDEGEENPTGCNPVMIRLAGEMEGVECEDLLALQQEEGFGLGEIMKAWYLSQGPAGFDGDWQEMLRRKQEEDIGWGQFKMAWRLAGEDGDPEKLLQLKQSGVGWGHIKKAMALESAGLLSFDDAIAMMQDGMGWGEIRDELGLEPGKPPWAGGGKDKNKLSPPPWSNAGGKNKADDDDQGD